MHNKKFIVSSFYKFVQLDNLQNLKKQFKKKIKDFNIKGTFILGHEGINGSFSVISNQFNKTKSILRVLIAPDLKFKTVMRQLRKDRGKTQIEVAKDLKIDPAKYRRMENISSGQSVTLKECADIMQYYNVESGMREIMVFLSKEDREKIIGRIKKPLTNLYRPKY